MRGGVSNCAFGRFRVAVFTKCAASTGRNKLRFCMTVKENDDEEEKNYTTNEMMTCGTSTKMFLPFDILELNFQAKKHS